MSRRQKLRQAGLSWLAATVFAATLNSVFNQDPWIDSLVLAGYVALVLVLLFAAISYLVTDDRDFRDGTEAGAQVAEQVARGWETRPGPIAAHKASMARFVAYNIRAEYRDL